MDTTDDETERLKELYPSTARIGEGGRNEILTRLRAHLVHAPGVYQQVANEFVRLEAEIKKCDDLIQWLWKQNEKDYADNLRLRDRLERCFGQFTVANAILDKDLRRGK